MNRTGSNRAFSYLLECQRYYIFREDLSIAEAAHVPSLPLGTSIARIGEDRMDEMLAMNGFESSSDSLRMRFMCRNVCLAVLKENRIIAFSWASFGLFQFESYSFSLLDNEAYLFDAFTLPEYRGKGLAVQIRLQLHRDLANMGRTRLYSVTLFNNKPALRFKEKINGRVVDRGFYVRLFNRWTFGTHAHPERLRVD